jgi:hypothetical protein
MLLQKPSAPRSTRLSRALFRPIGRSCGRPRRGNLKGDWLFPEGSQRLRYGPKSPAWQSKPGTPPIKCEAVSYLENGDLLVAQVGGTLRCPTSSDMKTIGKMPRVETWALIRAGRVKVDRTDVPDQVEEWDIFVVENAFDFASTRFAPGDLVAYRRREKGNELNVATMFRHLQKMP